MQFFICPLPNYMICTVNKIASLYKCFKSSMFRCLESAENDSSNWSKQDSILTTVFWITPLLIKIFFMVGLITDIICCTRSLESFNIFWTWLRGNWWFAYNFALYSSTNSFKLHVISFCFLVHSSLEFSCPTISWELFPFISFCTSYWELVSEDINSVFNLDGYRWNEFTMFSASFPI